MHTSTLRSTRKFGRGRNLHLHVTVDASVSPGLSAHMGNPGIYLSMVLLIVRSSVVTCVLEGREAQDSDSEDDERRHHDAKGSGDFVTHVEG